MRGESLIKSAGELSEERQEKKINNLKIKLMELSKTQKFN